MESEFPKVIELALQQGIWAVLYIYLFFKMLKDNAAREEKFQVIIDRLSDKIEHGIEDIQDSLDELKAIKKTQKEKENYYES